MTQSRSALDADRDLKAKHRAMWALGDYPAVASGVIPSLGQILVSACRVGPGDRVLDIAAGSGNAAIPAALTGATVVATDLTPELFDIGRRDAEDAGATVTWQEADAEAMPFGDASADVTLSCVGVMFAPHHQVAADELVRVTRPGGRIGLLSWTPAGFIGRMFATMKPYAPAPPPGAQPPPLWGDEDHVRTLLGDRVTDLTASTGSLRVDRFPTGEAFRDFFKTNYGPTIAVYRALAGDPERVAALDGELAELARRHDLGGGAMDWDYLLVTASRAG
ncbi:MULTISPECIES: class I SAM-dependent methyltransferase [unclassified Rhodococcus (in: high G+C Gram-positive bacteria)]|uniref:class I SAM-dependent methyltransferase n=1 Tax=unclassified Rhodococcus (in: high G+C Gram-positive bacteria) TaxID=192944 RepID=UPI00146CF371|nr:MULTISPECIES: methyltransferase domain-containing protein [unclassified Rhodococcus (in: high G+C Gram-positive bacteria)]MBF0660775.1 class I SAM-dependent methyltransferase [Rhodococcus sp. (in: high G+C Gram-positive bacteria)]NME79253.1 methyltransferase domain-containing protein [Rhodococcus sp. 105337]